jgi:hypothetical protein
MSQQVHPCDAEFLEAICKFQERSGNISSKYIQSDNAIQEEAEDGNWGLFSFAYNQWLSKTREIVSKRRMERQKESSLEVGSGNAYPDDMTDQVSLKKYAHSSQLTEAGAVFYIRAAQRPSDCSRWIYIRTGKY